LCRKKAGRVEEKLFPPPTLFMSPFSHPPIISWRVVGENFMALIFDVERQSEGEWWW
jgi:hypothetical protein